ncbi:MAG: YggT family protein [Firmicutes bacterium HGW-Firmicutes-1]|jgi:YggT family protein|nr:MAG: YggT family protein [Firmicutes bacterium HGW-Firmicutes-1]
MDLFLLAIDKFLYILEVLILVRVVVSWLPIARDNPFIEFLYTVTEPILAPIRIMINKSIFGGKGQVFDLSPLIAYFILQLLHTYLK